MDNLEYDEVEFTDLEQSGSASSNMPSWLAHIVPDRQSSPQRRRYRRRWRLKSTMALLLLLVILFTLNRGPFAFIMNGFRTPHILVSGASSSFAAMSPPPQLDGISCFVDAAPSADSHFIAVLGYQNCPKDSYVVGLVDMYDACTGRLIRQVYPDGAIVRRFYDSLPTRVRYAIQKDRSDPPAIDYEHVLWSPDSQRLAITFAIAGQPSLYGVVLMNSDDASEQVVLQQQPTPGPFNDAIPLIAYW